jgi:hypothetical protein
MGGDRRGIVLRLGDTYMATSPGSNTADVSDIADLVRFDR